MIEKKRSLLAHNIVHWQIYKADFRIRSNIIKWNGINFILAYKKNEKPNRKQNKMEEGGGG